MSLFRVTIVIILLCITSISSSGQKQQKHQADFDTKVWRYDILAEQVGSQGSYLVKVWSYSRNPNIAQEQAKKNAVHGIIFKGVPGREGIPQQVALASDPTIEERSRNYFDEFFADNGKYMKFVELANDGQFGPNDIAKIGKEYKIGIIVSVNVATLRKQLEVDNIIPSLSSGF